MLFSQVVGQEKLKQKLRGSVLNKRVAHAQMLVGPSGVGTLPLALAYAQYLACTKRGEQDACGTCDSCIRYQKLEHPDLQLIFPKNKTAKVDHQHYSSKDFVVDWRKAVIKNPYISLNEWLKELGIENKQGLISVDDSREILQNLSYKAYEAEYRVVIIWLAEYMNIAAANKLLKVLEEPPARTVFLLISEDSEQLLQTIISRVQVHRLERLKDTQIAEHLLQGFGQHEEAVQLASMADGDLTLAKTLLDNKESVVSIVRFFISWMRAAFGNQLEVVRDLADEFHGAGREQQKEILLQSMAIVRKVLLYGILPETQGRLLKEELEFVQKFSRFIEAENTGNILEIMNDAHYHIERNANARIVFTDITLKIGAQLQSVAMR